jgi:hypothetical protein
MTNDRLEQIADQRGTDPDIAWLCRRILKLEADVEFHHRLALELHDVANRRLAEIVKLATER